MREVDVLVIGAGPGGYPAAIRAAQLGQKVVCVERERLGGVCLNWGCIPSKALLKTAELAHKVRHAADWGLATGELKVDYPAVIERSRQVAARFERGVKGLFKKYGVESVAGEARLSGPGQVVVRQQDGTELAFQARHIVLATGARARVFPGIEVDGVRVQTYREAIVTPEAPQSVVILGAGAIGIEFAYFWNALGAQVTVVEGREEILPLEDPELAAVVRKSLAKQGVTFLTGRKVVRCAAEDGQAATTLDDGTALRSDRVLVALGISPNTSGLGLEALGLELDRGFLPIDPLGRTRLPGLWAVGDCTTRGGLAHTATAQGHRVAEAIVHGHAIPVDYSAIPACTYCQPQVASVGLREDQARARGLRFKVGRFPFQANGKAQGAQAADGFVKVLVAEETGEILGAHIVGSEATELIAEYTLARTAELTADQLLHTVHAHPTYGEALLEAVAVSQDSSVHL